MSDCQHRDVIGHEHGAWCQECGAQVGGSMLREPVLMKYSERSVDGGARELEQEDSPAIKSLRDRCEANVVLFTNDDVSELLVEIDRLRLAMERKAGR